jgi:hypothetical protein
MHQPERSSSLYDPGLGSRRSKPGFLFTRSVRWIYDKVSQATGLGITQNVIDCYAAIIRLAKPEDRIFLFGFSRGAYTIRSVAAVVALCGVPTRNRDGNKLPLDESGSKNLATYAVKHIISSRPLARKKKRRHGKNSSWKPGRNLPSAFARNARHPIRQTPSAPMCIPTL